VPAFLGIIMRKGRNTVPAAFRKALGLKEGDKVAFALDPSDRSRATPSRPEDFKRLRRAFEEKKPVES
jgi:AbrB family looped-hinge helix DNA binding protein